jgi:hypothetical protein
VNFDVPRQFFRPRDAEDALNRLDLDLFLVIPTDFARSLHRATRLSTGDDRRGGR